MIHYDIPEELHRQAKMQAAAKGMTLKAWLEQAIAEKVEREQQKGQKR